MALEVKTQTLIDQHKGDYSTQVVGLLTHLHVLVTKRPGRPSIVKFTIPVPVDVYRHGCNGGP